MSIVSLGQTIPVLGLNLGFPGDASRIPNPVIVARPVNGSATLNLYFGDTAVVVPDSTGGTWLSVADFLKTQTNLSNLLAYFAGIAHREVKTQLGYPPTYGGQSVGYYIPGEIAEVQEQGAVLVTLYAGTPQSNQPVYMRVLANALISTVVGGIEAAADVALSTTATASAASNSLTVVSYPGAAVGQVVTGNGIPDGTYVTNVATTTITISANTTVALAAGTPLSFANTVKLPNTVFKTGDVDANNTVEINILQRHAS